jgi:ABC-2 type transport system permease protein
MSDRNLNAALDFPVVPAGAADLATPPARVTLLLSPRVRAVRNVARRLTPSTRARLALFALLGIGFGTAIFTFFYRTLSYFLAVPEFGPVLTYKLLSMVFMTFFSILLFSNIVTTLSTFYLSRDLDRIVAAPVPFAQFFAARFLHTVMDSSWMMLLFAAPAFLAYGTAHGSGPLFYLVTALTLPPFLIIPGAIGVAVTTILVNVFPARRTRDILVLLSVLAVAVLYLLFRLVQPERLVNPEGFSDFMEFLAAMQTPHWRFLPSTWATEAVFPLLGQRDGRPGFNLLLLTTTAAVSYMTAHALLARYYLKGWSKAQEGRETRWLQRPALDRALALLTKPFDVQTRLLIVKEAKTFFRDTTQWSQLILLLALVVVYVYNFSVLPLKGSPLVTFYFRNVIAFVNLALAAFVSAAVAVRFIFPAFSIEGKAFWILKAGPISLRRLWWAKFWIGVIPLLILGETLVVATNTFLGVMPFMMWLATGTLAAMVITIVALGLAVGAAYPNFEAENAAKIAAGAGGLVYMVLCMSFIGTVVVLEAWPVYVFFMTRLSGGVFSVAALVGIAASFGAVALLHLTVFIGSVRYGLRRLEQIEV